MLFSMFTIKDTVTRIDNLQKQIKPTTKIEELSTYKNKFYVFAYDLALGLGEAYFSTGRDLFNSLHSIIMQEITEVQKASSLDDFKLASNAIVSRFKDFDYEWDRCDYSSKAELFINDSKNKRQYALSSSRALAAIVKSIKVPINRDITLFYPDCNQADNIDAFNLVSDNLLAYGNEANEMFLPEAKRKMHKVVKGGLKGSRIQNNAFDIVYCQPQVLYEFDPNDFFFNKRVEKSYISDMFKYLRNDGIMVITMPCTRLFKDVCSMLAKQLKNIQVFKTGEVDFDSIGLIHIVGQKDPVKEPRSEEYSKLRRLFDYNHISTINDIEEFEYILPRVNTVIETFKGSALDLDEIESIVDNSSLIDKMLESQKVQKLDENIKHPLLPFNIGQLGLVLTSGCLDGIVDEGDGFKHLIKGRVSKYTMEVENDTDKGVEVTETTVNKVEINVLLPNGEFKVLA